MIPASLGLLRDAAIVAEDHTRRIHWDDADHVAAALAIWGDIAVLADSARQHLVVLLKENQT